MEGSASKTPLRARPRLGDFKLGAAVLGRGLGRGFIYFDRLTVGPPDGGVPLPDRGGWGILRARPYPSSLQHARPMPKVSVIVPAYNEEATVLDVLDRVSEQRIEGVEFEIIVIDDGSTDCTGTLLEGNPHLYSELIRLKTNGGKGAAVKAGLAAAKGDYILFQDADLEYNPENYIRLIEPIKNKEAKVVYGSRVLPGAARTRPKTFDFKIRIIANLFLTFLSNLFNKQGLSDCHTCYKVFSSDVLKKIQLYENGFNFCPEITAKVSRLGIKIKEVPIDYYGRTHVQGKKIVFLDGIKAIYSIFKYNLFKNT